MKVKLAKNVSNSCWVIGKHFSIATFELQVTRVKSCGRFYDKISSKLQSEIQHEQYPHEAVKGFIYLHHWQLRFAQFCELEIHVDKCELLVGSLSVLNEPIKTLWKLQDYRENEQITFLPFCFSSEKRENMNKRRKTSLFKSRKWHFSLLNIFFSAGNEKHVLSRGWMEMESQRFRNREVKSSHICLNCVQTKMMVCIHLGLGINNNYLLELEVQSWDQPLRNWRSLCTE